MNWSPTAKLVVDKVVVLPFTTKSPCIVALELTVNTPVMSTPDVSTLIFSEAPASNTITSSAVKSIVVSPEALPTINPVLKIVCIVVCAESNANVTVSLPAFVVIPKPVDSASVSVSELLSATIFDCPETAIVLKILLPIVEFELKSKALPSPKKVP